MLPGKLQHPRLRISRIPPTQYGSALRPGQGTPQVPGTHPQSYGPGADAPGADGQSRRQPVCRSRHKDLNRQRSPYRSSCNTFFLHERELNRLAEPLLTPRLTSNDTHFEPLKFNRPKKWVCLAFTSKWLKYGNLRFD